jgi:hypothetical protein
VEVDARARNDRDERLAQGIELVADTVNPPKKVTESILH